LLELRELFQGGFETFDDFLSKNGDAVVIVARKTAVIRD
jgi:hypothetical protein